MIAGQALYGFRDFLEASWGAVEKLRSLSPSAEDQVADWLQANWEVFVEAVLFPEGNHYLEVYGDGAECNGASSRVWKPWALPTHRVRCLPRTGTTVVDVLTGKATDPRNLSFWGFVSWDGEQYDMSPPFHHVLLEDRSDSYVIKLDEVEFDCEKR